MADVLRNWAFTSANGVAHVLEVDALGYSNIPSQYNRNVYQRYLSETLRRYPVRIRA